MAAAARIPGCLSAPQPQATPAGGLAMDGAQPHGRNHGKHRTPVERHPGLSA